MSEQLYQIVKGERQQRFAAYDDEGFVGVLVPDDSLQRIADAWDEWRQAEVTDKIGTANNAFASLAELLDGLVNDECCGCKKGTNHAEFGKALATGYEPMPGEYAQHMLGDTDE